VSFMSHYLKDGSETAIVTVTFSTGATSERPTYKGDAIAKQENLSVTVPSGATSMRVTWSLTNGNNNWYWAVDNPRITVS
jgi:hypothetical protein